MWGWSPVCMDCSKSPIHCAGLGLPAVHMCAHLLLPGGYVVVDLSSGVICLLLAELAGHVVRTPHSTWILVCAACGQYLRWLSVPAFT